MMQETLIRSVGSDPKIINGIKSGIYRICGGVIRIVKGVQGAGRIVAHLQVPGDSEQVRESIARMQQVLGQKIEGVQSGVDTIQESIGALQNLQVANLALSGLNLAVSVAGFAIVCNKLNDISNQLESQSAKLDHLIALAVEAKHLDQLRDVARFRGTVKTIRQFAEMGDVDGLKGQISTLHEQYEFTKLTLMRSASGACKDEFVGSLELMDCLQQRMMHLGFLQSYVQQRIGAYRFAVEALHELQNDWLTINETIVNTVSANQEWVGQLSQESGNNIISLLEFRKKAAPAIEYQASLLEFVSDKPHLIECLANEPEEIRLLVA